MPSRRRLLLVCTSAILLSLIGYAWKRKHLQAGPPSGAVQSFMAEQHVSATEPSIINLEDVPSDGAEHPLSSAILLRPPPQIEAELNRWVGVPPFEMAHVEIRLTKKDDYLAVTGITGGSLTLKTPLSASPIQDSWRIKTVKGTETEDGASYRNFSGAIIISRTHPVQGYGDTVISFEAKIHMGSKSGPLHAEAVGADIQWTGPRLGPTAPIP